MKRSHKWSRRLLASLNVIRIFVSLLTEPTFRVRPRAAWQTAILMYYWVRKADLELEYDLEYIELD